MFLNWDKIIERPCHAYTEARNKDTHRCDFSEFRDLYGAYPLYSSSFSYSFPLFSVFSSLCLHASPIYFVHHKCDTTILATMPPFVIIFKGIYISSIKCTYINTNHMIITFSLPTLAEFPEI